MGRTWRVWILIVRVQVECVYDGEVGLFCLIDSSSAYLMNRALQIEHQIPNRAWGFWAQGADDLDPVIELCIWSWRKKGGFDQSDILEAGSVFDFLTRESLPSNFASLPVQIQSDLVRLGLLHQYGGVWMDASTLVSFEVMPWVDSRAGHSGLFVFQNPGRGKGGRRFETGFIAARQGHPFIGDWFQQMARFFQRRRIHQAHSAYSDAPILAKKIFAVLNLFFRKTHRRSAFWARAPLRWLPIYPFFIVHYLGNWVLQKRRYRSLLQLLKFVDASRYLALRTISNARGWVQAAEAAELGEVPVHDIEFRKELIHGEFESLGALANRSVG